MLGHVDPDHLLLVAKQELGGRLHELGLTDTRRSEEHQHTVGAIEAPSVAPCSGPGDGPPRTASLLTDDAPLKAVFDVLEPVTDVAEDHVSRDLSRVRDHLDDIR